MFIKTLINVRWEALHLTVVQTSRLDALTLVLQGPGLLDVGHGWHFISEVYLTTRHQTWLEKTMGSMVDGRQVK
jgi:hypothetical protein